MSVGRIVTSVRDVVQLRSRLRHLKVLLIPAPPPPLPKNAVDPTRLIHLGRYRPETPGHAEIFLRDSLAMFEPVGSDQDHWDACMEWMLRAQSVTGSGGFS